MKADQQPVTLPLDYVSEMAFEMHLMRGECGDLARQLINQSTPDEPALDECAQLEEALAQAQRTLHAVVARINRQRSKKGKSYS
jgi:hypothetical protein